MINLRALSYLVALGEYRSFSRAAEHCCITQSTLSIQLRKLEDYLGVELVERTRSRVQLTSAGRQVSLLARMILATTSEIQQVAQRAREKGDRGAPSKTDPSIRAKENLGARASDVTKAPLANNPRASAVKEPSIDEINCLRLPKG